MRIIILSIAQFIFKPFNECTYESDMQTFILHNMKINRYIVDF